MFQSLLRISLFFWLDPKEPKGQDAAKLQPRVAKRWLAAAPFHRAYLNRPCARMVKSEV